MSRVDHLVVRNSIAHLFGPRVHPVAILSAQNIVQASDRAGDRPSSERTAIVFHDSRVSGGMHAASELATQLKHETSASSTGRDGEGLAIGRIVVRLTRVQL
jgi:hypothetical protein